MAKEKLGYNISNGNGYLWPAKTSSQSSGVYML